MFKCDRSPKASEYIRQQRQISEKTEKMLLDYKYKQELHKVSFD